jgi:hypothetical protein
MSCFFVTLLSWDMAGDKGGWLQALWVPIVGAVMALAIWVSDRQLMTGAAQRSWSPRLSSLFSSFSSSLPNDHPPFASTRHPETDHSIELVLSSLHHDPGDAHGASDTF